MSGLTIILMTVFRQLIGPGHFQKWHGWLLLLGFLLRFGYSLTLSREAAFGGWDGREFHAYAQSLMHFQGDDYPRFFNFIRAPFYALFLMPFVAFSSEWVWPIQLAQSLLGVLQAVILGRIAGGWAGARAGQWAFLIALLHPFLIYYCAFVLTETVFITLLWAGLAAFQNLAHPDSSGRGSTGRWLVWAGVAWALACLTRPGLQLFLIIAVLWLGVQTGRPGGARAALRHMTAFTVVVSALLLPWLLGNLWAHGEFTLAPRHGQAVYLQTHAVEYLHMYEAKTKGEYYRAFTKSCSDISVHSPLPPESWMAVARAFPQNYPAEWRRLQWHKFIHFWTPWLNPLIFSRPQFLISVGSQTPLFAFAALELWRRQRSGDPFLLLLLGVVAVGYLVGGWLFIAAVRYRLPFVDVAFLVLTASWLGHYTRRPNLSPARFQP